MKPALIALALVASISPAQADEIEEGCKLAAAKVVRERAGELFMPLPPQSKFSWHINSKSGTCYGALVHITGECLYTVMFNADTGKIEAATRIGCVGLDGKPLRDFGVIPSRPTTPLVALRFLYETMEVPYQE